jgi:hypothetical protein
MTARPRSCPLCGGQIHAIASRCKHCKAELVAAPAVQGAPDHAVHAVATQSPRDAAPPGSSAWSRRWPLIAMALALLVIGASMGVLVERWLRAAESEELRRELPKNRPREVPDHMPGVPGLR